jgi:hypothetical protein
MTTRTEHACANCGAALSGRFCASCGQKVAALDPSIGDLLHELAHELLHVDGKIARSVYLLFTAPGALTREHAAGRRASQVSPIRLYLLFSVVYFAVAAFTPSMNLRLTVGAQHQSGYTFETKPVERHSDPEELRKLGFKSDDELRQAASDAIVHWMPRALFLLVPLFAGIVGLVVRRSRQKYPQHLYFALHVHAAWFLLLALASAARLVPVAWVGSAVAMGIVVWMIAYFVLALRRAYGVTIGGALWRTAAVAVTYGVLLVAALVAIVLPIVVGKA